MSYRLKFLPSAFKEWKKLGETIREQFKKKLAERLEIPEVVADRLRGFPNHYKIKLRSSRYRLVYEVENEELIVYVITVGKWDKDFVYKVAEKKRRDRQDGR